MQEMRRNHRMTKTLREQYQKVLPSLMKELHCSNPFALPKIVKVVLNSSFGKLISGKSGDEAKKVQEDISYILSAITGQRPAPTRARKSIAGFKLREGSVIGVKVTLRGKRMDDFLSRLIHVTLPRSRDFRGISASSIDENGNLAIGVKEHLFFPEIAPEKTRGIYGFEIIIATSANDKKKGEALFRALGFPLKKE